MIGLVLLGVLAAAADDGARGEADIDQEVRLSLRGDAIQVEYVVQLGRQAAFAEALQIDADRDGRFSPEEQARYFARLEESIRAGFELRVEGREVALRRAGEMRLEMPFRKIYRFEAERSGGGRLEFHNENFAESPGAVSLIVEPAEGTDVVVDADPSALRRDLFCDVRSGEGRVERRAIEREALPEPSGASLGLGTLARILSLVGLGIAGILAGRGRKAAALAALLGSAACGILAVAAGLPSDADARKIFLALHEEAARAGDAAPRRVKPLETRIESSIGTWGPEFRVHHRWASYESLTHSGHAHSAVQEREARYRVCWQNGAWRLVGQS